MSQIVGANHNTIREWVKKAESETQSYKEYASEREELLALRREFKETLIERDPLKKLSCASPRIKSERELSLDL